MNADAQHAQSRLDPQRQQRWVKVALYVVFLLIVAWLYASQPSANKSSTSPTSPPPTPSAKNSGGGSTATERQPRPSRPPQAADRADPSENDADVSPPAKPRDQTNAGTIVRNARVTDEDGQVIYRGDIDLGPTLDRIERGKRLRFSHDGIVFENRERRLPQKPSGYYHEFIHPTPGDDGPGGQRVVLGRNGEVYYTPDHYHTFRRVQ